jgi:hypothetical protein
MAISKKYLKDMLATIVDELPEPDAVQDEEDLAADAADLKSSLTNNIVDIVGWYFWEQRLVVCKLSTCRLVVKARNAIRCRFSADYYCETHNLIKCPKCGARL